MIPRRIHSQDREVETATRRGGIGTEDAQLRTAHLEPKRASSATSSCVFPLFSSLSILVFFKAPYIPAGSRCALGDIGPVRRNVSEILFQEGKTSQCQQDGGGALMHSLVPPTYVREVSTVDLCVLETCVCATCRAAAADGTRTRRTGTGTVDVNPRSSPLTLSALSLSLSRSLFLRHTRTRAHTQAHFL